MIGYTILSYYVQIDTVPFSNFVCFVNCYLAYITLRKVFTNSCYDNDNNFFVLKRKPFLKKNQISNSHELNDLPNLYLLTFSVVDTHAIYNYSGVIPLLSARKWINQKEKFV